MLHAGPGQHVGSSRRGSPKTGLAETLPSRETTAGSWPARDRPDVATDRACRRCRLRSRPRAKAQRQEKPKIGPIHAEKPRRRQGACRDAKHRQREPPCPSATSTRPALPNRYAKAPIAAASLARRHQRSKPAAPTPCCTSSPAMTMKLSGTKSVAMASRPRLVDSSFQ